MSAGRARVAAGEFERVYAAHQASVLARVRRVLRPGDGRYAEDVAQEVWAAVVAVLSEFSPPARAVRCPVDAAAAGRFVTACPVCELCGGPFRLAEAEMHAGTHDDRRHGGEPTTLICPAGEPAGLGRGAAVGGAA